MRNLKDYLYDVMELELSAYEQKQIISHIEQTIKTEDPPAPPSIWSDFNNYYKIPTSTMFGIYWGVILLIGGIVTIIVALAWSSTSLIFGLPMAVIGALLLRNTISSVREKTASVMADHRRQIDKLHHNRETVKKIIVQLISTLKATQKALSQLYAQGVIFPKYQSLVPICSFYEYLSSGRCEALEGEHGAYNLYESELRMNRIVDRLDAIQDSMEQLKTTQYCLYTGLAEVNSQVRMMRETTDKLLDTASYIAATNSITAYCSDVTRRNTELLIKNS